MQHTKKEKWGQSSTNYPDLQNNDSSVEDKAGTTGLHNVHASFVSGATDPPRNFVSQKRLEHYNRRRIQALCAYDPLKVHHTPSSSVFIPSEHLQLNWDQCDNVTQTTITLGHAGGKEFTIIEGSKCSGFHGSPCGKANTQLSHQWRIDHDHGVLITAVRAACRSCQTQEVYPTPMCATVDGSGQRCNAWASRYKQNPTSRTGYCQVHFDRFGLRRSDQRKQQKLLISDKSLEMSRLLNPLRPGMPDHTMAVRNSRGWGDEVGKRREQGGRGGQGR